MARARVEAVKIMLHIGIARVEAVQMAPRIGFSPSLATKYTLLCVINRAFTKFWRVCGWKLNTFLAHYKNCGLVESITEPEMSTSA